MSHPHAGWKPAAVAPAMASSPDSIAIKVHPTLGSCPFHRVFWGQADAHGLPYLTDNTEADLLGGSLGGDTVYGGAGWLTSERAKTTMTSIAKEVHLTLGKSGFL